MKSSMHLYSLLIVLALSPYGPSIASTQAQKISIGSEEPDKHSHAAFPKLPHDITEVSTHLVIDRAIPKGLNYFALQVNFPNHTWAHGGLQLIDNVKQMNWGGLVNRGGGTKDYHQSSPADDIALIQNPTGSSHTGPYDWQEGRSYTVCIKRGKHVHLPPGDYIFISGHPPLHLQKSRDMWEWILTIRPDGHPGNVINSTLYSSSPVIHSFTLWNECGYGACGHQQHATWTYPQYLSEAAPHTPVEVSTYTKF